ncbi:MAG: epoxyqueuosine reductase QueH [Bacillota bacterium]|nr:epoxyqueuosine reductase QueH [Bacillota bacterium]
MNLDKKSLLLHSCCGPCSTAVLERLVEDFDVTIFFYNPNITEAEEYNHRLEEQKRYIKEANLPVAVIEAEYNVQDYYNVVLGLEQEPEGGARCTECFKLRLQKTAEYAKEHGYDCWDTTLTVSPYKNSKKIHEIGNAINEDFLAGDYKKKDGYKRSIELSKQYNLYRQHFCGCEFAK